MLSGRAWSCNAGEIPAEKGCDTDVVVVVECSRRGNIRVDIEQQAHRAIRGCNHTGPGESAFMDCPATIWIVRLLPMDASCWKKMTAQYPPRPAQTQAL